MSIESRTKIAKTIFTTKMKYYRKVGLFTENNVNRGLQMLSKRQQIAQSGRTVHVLKTG